MEYVAKKVYTEEDIRASVLSTTAEALRMHEDGTDIVTVLGTLSSSVCNFAYTVGRQNAELESGAVSDKLLAVKKKYISRMTAEEMSVLRRAASIMKMVEGGMFE